MAKMKDHSKNLLPHSYVHDFVPGDTYIAARTEKGHNVVFRVKRQSTRKAALSECAFRGIKPLYIVNTKRR